MYRKPRAASVRRTSGISVALAVSALLFTTLAHAECGGLQQCIAISTDPAVAPAHSPDGINRPAPTVDFGNQTAATTSAARTILVAGVEGPAGTRATLDVITLSGTNASDFTITGGTCATGTPTLLHDGASAAQIANACTITVTFNPAAVGVKNAQLNVQTAAIVRVAPLTGTGTPSLTGPGVTDVTLSVRVNSTAVLDLAPFITGAATGVAIVTTPAHGVATTSGTTITYTPTRDYFGPDTFSYAAFNATGSSSAAVVTITVVDRPDPSKDASVIGLVSAQARTVRRFARAQISNFHRRMESLHRGAGDNSGDGPARRGALGYASDRAHSLNGPANFGTGTQPGRDPFSQLAHGKGALPPILPPSQTPQPNALVNSLLGAASNHSLNLAYSSDRGGGGSGLGDGTGVWVGGTLSFGTREQNNDGSGMRFRTDGVSIGVDRRFTDRLALGLGLGYAHDRTDIGTDGTQSRSSGASVVVYGSYQPSRNTFIDGLIGYGDLKHDSDRYVAAVDEVARAHRKSDQIFASIAAGYEHRKDGVLVSPYARLDLAHDRLKQATEAGAGLNALTYFDQDVNTLQLALGVRAESRHATRFGLALPRLRFEVKHDFEGEDAATISYADQFAGPRYSVSPTGMKRTAIVLGIGSDFLFRGGLRIGADYQLQHSFGPDRSHAVRLWLAKDLDGKGTPMLGYSSAKLFGDPVRVEAGVMWDDNLTRARETADKLSDHIYLLGVSKTTILPITDYTRMIVRGFIDGEKPYRYTGLDRISGGVYGELQHRTSGAFDAPTFGFFARALAEDYHSELRGGYRYSFGLNMRQAVTDRVDAFGALARNVRDAEHPAFDMHDYSARFNLDYSLGARGALYLGGEYRRGDAVSTAPFALQSVDIAEAVAPDDAFGRGTLFAYRFDAKTVIWTLGYNWPLGPRDSIDFSWRRAESKPTSGGSGIYGYAGDARYIANQLTLVYLMRF